MQRGEEGGLMGRMTFYKVLEKPFSSQILACQRLAGMYQFSGFSAIFRLLENV